MCIINCICNSLCMLSWLSMRLTEMNAIYSCHAETTISIYLNVLLSNSPWGRKLSPKYLGLFCKMLQFSMKNSTPQRNSYSSSVSDSHFFNKYHFWELCFRYLRALKKRNNNLVLCWSFQACRFRRVIVCVICVQLFSKSALLAHVRSCWALPCFAQVFKSVIVLQLPLLLWSTGGCWCCSAGWSYNKGGHIQSKIWGNVFSWGSKMLYWLPLFSCTRNYIHSLTHLSSLGTA